MKFAVEIDLDWIEEDSSIDEEVKHQIITSIENKVLKALQEQVLTKAKEKIDEQINVLVTANISTMVGEKVAELMTLNRTATDQYGRVTKENFTIESMLIDAVDGAINKKTLTSDGRLASDGYNSRAEYSHFDYYATKNIPAMVDTKVKELGEKVKKDIELLVTEKIKTQVADKLTALIVDNSTALSLRSEGQAK